MSPMDRSRYPPHWADFSLSIRCDRAEWRCECRGQCGRKHYFRGSPRCRAQQGAPTEATGKPVVLTVAHLNHHAGPCRCEPKCADRAHVLAMCQACHLRLDAPRRRTKERAKSARRTCLLGTGVDK